MTDRLLLLVSPDSPRSTPPVATAGRRSPRWPVFLLQAQLAIVYGFATLSKLNGDWFSGHVLEVNLLRVGPVDLPSAFERQGFFVAWAVGTLLVEGFLAFAFFVPRLQRAAVVVGLGFHAAIV